MILCALCFALLSETPEERERRALASLAEAGASILVHEAGSDGTQNSYWYGERPGRGPLRPLESIHVTVSRKVDLALLAELGHLHELFLYECADDTEWERLQSLTHLKRLRVYSCGDDSLLRAAAKLENLEDFEVESDHISAGGIEALAKSPSLIRLRVGGPGIRSTHVGALARLATLRDLGVGGPSLDKYVLNVIATMPQLRVVHLSGVPLDIDEVREFCVNSDFRIWRGGDEKGRYWAFRRDLRE